MYKWVAKLTGTDTSRKALTIWRWDEKPRLAVVLFTIMVIVRCDRSFGMEAPVNHLGWGFFLTHDKLFLV